MLAPSSQNDDVTRDVTVMLFRPMGLDPDEKKLTLEKHKSESCTPPTINIEPENDGLVSVIFLFQGARILRFQPLIFRGVTSTCFTRWLNQPM